MKHRLRGPLLLAAGAVLLTGGLVTGFIFRTRALLSRHAEEAMELLERFPLERCTRPPILEPEETGNAWAFEIQAITVAEPNNSSPLNMHSLYRGAFIGGDSEGLEETPEDLESHRESMESAIQFLSSALKCRTLTPEALTDEHQGDAGESLCHWLLASARLLHSQGKEESAVERVVLADGLNQDLARHGSLYQFRSLLWIERMAGQTLRAILSSHDLSARDLELLARRLDRLAQGRPSFSLIARQDGALSRRDVLDAFTTVGRGTAEVWSDLEPGWRDLWSMTLCKARRVISVDRVTRQFADLDRLPSWKRVLAAYQIDASIDAEPCDPNEVPNALMVREDLSSQLYGVLERFAVAIAWYEADHGDFPTRLADLRPKYFSGDPVCPCTGRPLNYDAGRIWSDATPQERHGPMPPKQTPEDPVDWTIRRKGK